MGLLNGFSTSFSVEARMLTSLCPWIENSSQSSSFKDFLWLVTARKRSCGKVMFLQVSVILSTGGGACVVVAGGGRIGVHGCRGECMVQGGMRGCGGGHAWLWGGGMRGCGGACIVAGGACIGHNEIRSMSGRYAFYWNAFLFPLPD